MNENNNRTQRRKKSHKKKNLKLFIIHKSESVGFGEKKVNSSTIIIIHRSRGKSKKWQKQMFKKVHK